MGGGVEPADEVARGRPDRRRGRRVRRVLFIRFVALGRAGARKHEPTAWEQVDATIGRDGIYSKQGALWAFSVLSVPDPQHFTIAYGDTVSKDRPASGAGRIGGWGGRDDFTFEGRAGDKVQVVPTIRCANTPNTVTFALYGPGATQATDSTGNTCDRSDRLHRHPRQGRYVDGARHAGRQGRQLAREGRGDRRLRLPPGEAVAASTAPGPSRRRSG